ncbi:MAG TPA: formylglycine-generating enzyme family protein [Tepidisphaeraceae bacterium]|jgi:formylglycine-generating enzyme required for sulfatase activity|nr:formylglycine-generating enzyme family protein [Tepidisphaeraceae bacterium]
MTSTLTAPLPAGTTFRDADAAPEMVVLPAGAFTMGATDGDDKFISRIELPRHTVQIKPNVAIGRYPVTFDAWDAYSAAVPSAHRPDDCGWGRGWLPVFNISWDDVQGYLLWLSRITGRAYRLPTEAEWEYGCRAGTTGVFATGSNITVEQANFLYYDYRQEPGKGRPVAVGSYPANAFGLFDMHGNVCELTADDWHDDYTGAPTDGSAWMNSGDRPSQWKVVRNGGWDALPRVLRCAYRDWIGSAQRFDNTGFRVACDL